MGELLSIAKGDVHIFCPTPDVLMEPGRLAVAQVARFDDLESELPGIRNFYETAAMREAGVPRAFVPDIRTIRSCTPTELERLVRSGEAEAIQDPRNVVFIPASYGADPLWDEFRCCPDPGDEQTIRHANCTPSPPDMLTTTLSKDNLVEEGPHIDIGEVKYRVTVNYGPMPRGLWLGTHSPALLSEIHGTPVSTSSELRQLDPKQIGSVVRLLLQPGDLYLACTGGLVHDGTTLLSDDPKDALEKVRAGFRMNAGYENLLNMSWLAWYLQKPTVNQLSTAAFHKFKMD